MIPATRPAAKARPSSIAFSVLRTIRDALRDTDNEEPSHDEWLALNRKIEAVIDACRRGRDGVIRWFENLTGVDLFRCEVCETYKDVAGSTVLSNRRLCDDCHSTHSLCEDCDALVHDDDGRWVCNDARRVCDSCAEDYPSCSCCDYEGHRDNMHRDHGAWYCDNHVPSEDDDEDGDGVLSAEADVTQEYHGRPWLALPGEITDGHGNRKSARPTMWLGFELEVVARDGRWAAVHAIQTALGKRGIIKNDGSIPEDGFEIVSLPATLAYHQAGWGDAFFVTLAAHARGWDEKSCGMHVHMSRDALTPLQIARLQVFVNGDGLHVNNRAFIEKIAGRGATDYCRHYDKRLTDCAPVIERHTPMKPVNYDEDCRCAACVIQRDAYERALEASRGSEALRHQFRQMHRANDGRLSRLCKDRRNHDRYQAINLQAEKTIEWRIFQSNVSRLGFLKNLEFCHAAAKFCADAGNTGLHSDNFLAWIDRRRGEYPNLVRWAVRERLIARRHADAPGAVAPAIAA